MIQGIFGRPSIGSESISPYRNVFTDGSVGYLPGANGVIDYTKSRDPGNTLLTTTLRPGLLMGKVTSGGKWAPSVLGLTAAALTSTGTSLTVPEAVGDEIVRRIGATGTFKLTGPPTAAGTVRTMTATYSAVAAASGGNRVVTITALGVNEVQTVTFNAAATGGTYVFRIPLADGTFENTASIAWNTTDATLLSNIQTALDNATGVANAIVVSGAAPDTTLTFTFSGTGYAGLAMAGNIEVPTMPTTPASYTVTKTSGVDGRFVTLSLVQPTDGSEAPITLIDDGTGLVIDAITPADISFPRIPISGVITPSQILNWPTDTSLRTWVKGQLRSNSTGVFVFNDGY